MMQVSFALCVAFWLGLLAGAQAFSQVDLAVGINGVAPVISNTTMNYHYNKHYAGYVTKLNDALSGAKKLPTLTDAIKSVAKAETVNRTIIQKQGGGAWNHALYFKTMATPGSAATQDKSVSAPLAAAIKKSFGGLPGLKKNMTDTAMGVFGSGWAWLCVAADGKLLVTTTANQDNPLMGRTVSKAPECTPILGIDVWEHAYYVDHGPARKDYVDAYWGIVNWPQVSANFASATSGKINDIVA